MRVLVLLFAIIGALGAGFMGVLMLDTIKKKEAEAGGAALKEVEVWKNLKLATYGMLAGIPLGPIGGYLALNRRGKLAALVLVAAYAIPFVIMAATGIDLSDNRARPMLFVPGGLLIAAFLSLFVGPGVPYKKPKPAPGISEDDDMVG